MAHNVSIRIDDKVVERWQGYDIESDMMNPADGFSLSMGNATREVIELCALNAVIDVFIDGVPILCGFVGARDISGSKSSGTVLQIEGRDRGGRLVDESMPARSFRNKSLIQIASDIVAPWFSTVILDNADNRIKRRGGRKKGLAKSFPAVEAAVVTIGTTAGTPQIIAPALTVIRDAAARSTASRTIGRANRVLGQKEVEPGAKRWDTLSRIVRENGLMCWISADAQSVIIAQPDYTQEPQFAFYAPEPSSETNAEIKGNIVQWSLRESVEDRYERIRVLTAGRGDAARFGRALKTAGESTASAKQVIGPDAGKVFDWGDNGKELIVTGSDAKNIREANDYAADEMAKREGAGTMLSLTVQGHTQQLKEGAEAALYTFDTIAAVNIERIGLRGKFMIVRCNYSVSRDGGTVTQLELVPEGTKLTQ